MENYQIHLFLVARKWTKLMRCPRFRTICGKSLSGRTPNDPVQKTQTIIG